MPEYFEASAAIDWIRHYRAEQDKVFLRNRERFLTAQIVKSDLTPPSLPKSTGGIDERIKHFAEVRSFCASVIKQALSLSFSRTPEGEALASTYPELEPAIFTEVATFEMNDLTYADTGTIQRLDFNKSLTLLAIFAGLLTPPANIPGDLRGFLEQALRAINAYYEKMDHLLAYDFHRSHNRRDGCMRIGPYSWSTGYRWKKLDRPAAVLDPEQQKDFREQILGEHGLSVVTQVGPKLDRIKAEPVVLVIYYGYYGY